MSERGSTSFIQANHSRASELGHWNVCVCRKLHMFNINGHCGMEDEDLQKGGSFGRQDANNADWALSNQPESSGSESDIGPGEISVDSQTPVCNF